MTSPIFGRPRHEYHSYRDFWELVELSGFDWVYIDEMDIQSDNVYIFTGPDVNNEFRGATARIIYWLLEWYGDYWQRDGVKETWVSNATFAERIGAKFVPMGGHPDLGTTERGTDQFDLAHMSYDGIHRRGLLLNKIRDYAGVSIAPNGWFDERDFSLRNSRVMLHIHQSEDYPAIAPLRAVLAAAYALPLIAESGWSTAPYTEHVFSSDYAGLLRLVMTTLDMTNLTERGLAFHDYVCNVLRFKTMVEAAL